MKKTRILLTTTSFQDTPGEHHKLLAETGWEIVAARGPLNEANTLALMGEFDGYICGDDLITAAVIEKALPRLKVVSKYGIGVDKIDVKTLTAKGIPLLFTPGVNHTTVAEHTFLLLLALEKNFYFHTDSTRSGGWKRKTGRELLDKTIGIIGMGRIGQGIAKRAAHGFGMRVIYHNRSRLSADLEAACKATYVSKEELLRTADHVMLVVPYSAESHHTIGAKELGSMKPSATLVNIARGGIVDDVALAVALKNKQIAAAGLDVFEAEPALNPALLTVPNVVLTPHIASSTVKTRLAMAQLAADNLVSFFATGKALTPLNQVTSK